MIVIVRNRPSESFLFHRSAQIFCSVIFCSLLLLLLLLAFGIAFNRLYCACDSVLVVFIFIFLRFSLSFVLPMPFGFGSVLQAICCCCCCFYCNRSIEMMRMCSMHIIKQFFFVFLRLGSPSFLSQFCAAAAAVVALFIFVVVILQFSGEIERARFCVCSLYF